MNKQLRAFSIIIGLVLFSHLQVQAQSYSLEILGGNTLNGILQGSVLGASTMAVTNNNDIAPIRIGVGLGILYGIGVGVYDVQTFGGNKLLVKGFVNNGNNTSIIILLDTVYGAAAGAVIASAGMLVANEPLINGLQYGSGVGAWLGFGFGVFDAFILAEREQDNGVAAFKTSGGDGSFFTLRNDSHSFQLGFIQPTVNLRQEIDGTDIIRTPVVGVNGVSLKLRF